VFSVGSRLDLVLGLAPIKLVTLQRFKNDYFHHSTAMEFAVKFMLKTGRTKWRKSGTSLAPKIAHHLRGSRKFFLSKLAKDQAMITERSWSKV